MRVLVAQVHTFLAALQPSSQEHDRAVYLFLLALADRAQVGARRNLFEV